MKTITELELNEETFQEANINDLAHYFSTYKAVKDFCRTLKYEYQEDKIMIDSENVIENPEMVRAQMLTYFKLPYHQSKFKNLIIACRIIRNKYEIEN